MSDKKKPVRDPYLVIASTVAKHRSRCEKLQAMCENLEARLAKRRQELIHENQAFADAEESLTGRVAREVAEDTEEVDA